MCDNLCNVCMHLCVHICMHYACMCTMYLHVFVHEVSILTQIMNRVGVGIAALRVQVAQSMARVICIVQFGH